MDCRDMDKLVEAVTARIMQALGEADSRKRVLAIGCGDDITAALEQSFDVCAASGLNDCDCYDYVVLPFSALKSGVGAASAVVSATAAPASEAETLDLRGKKLIHERDLMDKCTSSTSALRIDRRAIVTALAQDLIRRRKIALIRVD